MIKDEDKALIFLSPLLNDKYETFVLILINDKSSISYDEVSAALMNHGLRKDKESSSSTAAEALTLRGKNSKRKAKEIEKDQSPRLVIVTWERDQHVFYKENEHRKKDCPKLKKKKDPQTEANVA